MHANGMLPMLSTVLPWRSKPRHYSSHSNANLHTFSRFIGIYMEWFGDLDFTLEAIMHGVVHRPKLA